METKCVIVVDSELPVGLIANATACLGFSLGSVLPDKVGPAQVDESGIKHGGLLSIPIPVLATTAECLRALVTTAYASELDYVFDLSEVAQSSKTQDEYGNKIRQISSEDMCYRALACYGPKKIINKYFGNLPLYKERSLIQSHADHKETVLK